MKHTLNRCWQAVPKHGCNIIFKNCLTNQHLKVKTLLVTCILMQTVYYFSLLNQEFIIIFIMYSPTNPIYPPAPQPSQHPDNWISHLNLCFPQLIKICPTPQHQKKKNKQTTQNNLKNFKSTTPKPVAESMLSVTPVAQSTRCLTKICS